jgi:hypothetical protein
LEPADSKPIVHVGDLLQVFARRIAVQDKEVKLCNVECELRGLRNCDIAGGISKPSKAFSAATEVTAVLVTLSGWVLAGGESQGVLSRCILGHVGVAPVVVIVGEEATVFWLVLLFHSLFGKREITFKRRRGAELDSSCAPKTWRIFGMLNSPLLPVQFCGSRIGCENVAAQE